MIGNIERAVRAHGERGHRYVHFEAGVIGNRMYLAAEALGPEATGIGGFYDEEVYHYLTMAPAQGQMVYHVAIGYTLPDRRLEA
jgi:nitroreductase